LIRIDQTMIGAAIATRVERCTTAHTAMPQPILILVTGAEQ
jgi:hypothetical protein